MYSLTKQQKIENYLELLRGKEEKVKNLNKEIDSIKQKIEKLQSDSMKDSQTTQN